MLLTEYVYEGCRDTIVVPAGFITDLASTPRFIWPLFPPFGDYAPAAAVHDRNLVAGMHPYHAHRIFKRHMLQLGVPYWKATLFHAFVSLYSIWRSSVASP